MLKVNIELCDLCGLCVGVCPEDALYLSEVKLIIIQEKCSLCLYCVNCCPFRAISVVKEK
ncbi:ferredoxin [candidate division KSB1 bacterium]|nr:MAG: ferredoxin [candidate division KSB1 bacterium]